MSTFIEYDPDQVFLLPPSMADWLPTNHVIHYVRDAVNELDLTAIFNTYKPGGTGRPAFSPRMLTAVWIYAHMVGIRSSRRLERALHENLAFRVLSGNQQPDFWTLNKFRTTHREALGNLLVQTVRLARKVGLAPMNQVAVDGTRIQANASKHSAMSYDRMLEKEKDLKKEIEEYLSSCDEADRLDNEKFGQKKSAELPAHLKESDKRLKAIRAAKSALEAEARDRARAEQEQRRQQAALEGRPFHPRINPEEAEPSPKAQRNFTDPESRIMAKKGKDVIQGYNGQAAVDAETQIILAADLTNMAADAPHLIPMLDQVVSNTDAKPAEVTADAGYFSERNVAETEYRLPDADVFIPPDRQKHSSRVTSTEPTSTTPAEVHQGKHKSEGTVAACSPTEGPTPPANIDVLRPPQSGNEVSPEGDGPPSGDGPGIPHHADNAANDPASSSPTPPRHASPPGPVNSASNAPHVSAAKRMREKLTTQHGRDRYKLRRCSVEPVFGQIKGARGLRQFQHRGQDKVRHMWRFECAVHNLLKCYTSGKSLVAA